MSKPPVYERLTPERRRHVRELIETYLREYWRVKLNPKPPLKLPSYGWETIWRVPTEALESASDVQKVRRGLGHISDPTANTALTVLEGEGMRCYQLPTEPLRIARVAVEGYIVGLPTHLEQPVAIALLQGQGIIGAADRLQMHRSSVRRRLDEALSAIGERVYGERWGADALAA